MKPCAKRKIEAAKCLRVFAVSPHPSLEDKFSGCGQNQVYLIHLGKKRGVTKTKQVKNGVLPVKIHTQENVPKIQYCMF